MRMLKIGFALVFFVMCIYTPSVFAESTNQRQYVFDFADLLTDQEKNEIEAFAKKHSADFETAFIILTVDGTAGKGIEQFMSDFYDEQAPGYNKPHGNTVMLSIDIQGRDVFLSGFKKGKAYLKEGRLTSIREAITPHLTAGNYADAFRQFITQTHQFMGYGPDGLLYQWWFQLAIALLLATIVVVLMAYSSGGRMTTTERDYFNPNGSGITRKHDNFIRTTVTKTKKPSSNSSGGGGGKTGGGRSYSGSGGKF